MDSQTLPKLPVVDFTKENLKPGTSSWLSASDEHGISYYRPSPSMPLIEGFTFQNATTLEGTQTFTNLMWPAGNDSFCKTMFSFSKLLAELHEMVLRMVFEGYGLEKYYDSHIASTTYLMMNLTSSLFPSIDLTYIEDKYSSLSS